MKTKFLALILAITFVCVLLAACTGTNPADTTAATDTTTAPDTTTVPPETTTVPPETTTVPPETTTVPPETTTAPPVIVYEPVNDMMDTSSDELITYFSKPEQSSGKSDGFVFVWKDEVYVHDSGLPERSAGSIYMYLYTLRKNILDANGISVTDTSYKLKINLIISHYHLDHVGALIDYILPSPYFAVENMWCTAESAFTSSPCFSDPYYCNQSLYGDYTLRPSVMEALKKYHPGAAIHELDFGTKQVLTTADGKVTFTLYAPAEDFGAGDIDDRGQGVGKLAYMYYKYSRRGNTVTPAGGIGDDLPMAIVNANSMWLKVEYGSRSMLFTGDIIKKLSPSVTNGEPFDLMLSHYGKEEFDVDLVKWPHHGELRNAATFGVVYIMKPAILVFTDTSQTVSSQDNQYWNAYTGVWYDTDNGLTVVTDGTYMKVSANGVTYDTVITNDTEAE